MILVQRRNEHLPRDHPGAEAGAGAGGRGRPAAHRRRARGQRPARGAALRRDAAATTCRWRRCSRSPLGGLSERELFELAHGREGTLWAALRAAPPERWPEVRALLADLRAQADFLRPFELLSRMLVRHDGRRRLMARLGAEAEDGIDALLDQALAYESVEAPSLTGFLDWFDRDEVAVKRRSDDGADQVRVMTVHGAKGLEAPIVILPDTGAAAGRRATRRRCCGSRDGQAVWRVRQRGRAAGVRGGRGGAARAGARREPAAALRRADPRQVLADRLRRRRRPAAAARAGTASWPRRWPGSGRSRAGAGRRRAGARPELDRRRRRRRRRRRPPRRPPLPGWARRPPRAPAAGRAAVSPSALGGAHVLAGEPTRALERGGGEGARARRCTACSSICTAGPPADRPRLAARLLPGRAGAGGAAGRGRGDARRAGARLRLRCRTASPRSRSRRRSPSSAARASLGRHRPAGGRRRTGCWRSTSRATRRCRRRPSAVPEGILRQMGAYRAALAAIWPDRRVETAILWTRTAPADAAAGRAGRRGAAGPAPADEALLTPARRGCGVHDR